MPFLVGKPSEMERLFHGLWRFVTRNVNSSIKVEIMKRKIVKKIIISFLGHIIDFLDFMTNGIFSRPKAPCFGMPYWSLKPQ